MRRSLLSEVVRIVRMRIKVTGGCGGWVGKGSSL